MDCVAEQGGEECSLWLEYHVELSQSSGVLSLPSGNRLADISLGSDTADSEIENEDTVLCSNTPHHLEDNIGIAPSDVTNDISNGRNQAIEKDCVLPGNRMDIRQGRNVSGCNMRLANPDINSLFREGASQRSERREPYGTSSLSLDDVRVALQENCDMLTDHLLLDDLLKSLDEKIQQDSVFGSAAHATRYENCTMPVVKPNRDPGLNILYSRSTTSKTSVERKESVPHKKDSTLHLPTGSSRSQNVPLSLSTQSDSVGTHGLAQEVRNDPVSLNTIRMPEVKSGGESAGNSYSEKHVKFQDSSEEESPLQAGASDAPSYTTQSHSIIKQLSEIRWRLQGWEELRTNPPAHGTSPLPLLHQLLNRHQVHQLEKKHLEDELAATKVALLEVRQAFAVERGVHEQREERLVEADQQLVVLQREWMATQDTVKDQLIALKDQCHHHKEEREALKIEVISLRSNSARQEEAVKDYDSLKVKVPVLVQELAGAKQEVEAVGEAYDGVMRAKRVVEDKLHVLTLQHQALLSRVVLEQQEKEALSKGKVSLEDEVKQLREEISKVRSGTHQHYQAQMETLVAQKSALLQGQLSQLDLNMKKKLEEQLDVQRQSHHRACFNMQLRHENKIHELETNHEAAVQRLEESVRELEGENRRLRDQQEGVFSVVTSIMRPTSQQDPSGMHVALSKEASTSKQAPEAHLTKGGTSWTKTSRTNSLPGSGKSASTIPPLGGFKSSDSSGDSSEGSMFQDGRHTVRPRLGTSPCSIPSCPTKDIATDPNCPPQNVSADKQKSLTHHCVNSQINGSEREFKSLPVLGRQTCGGKKLPKSSQLLIEKDFTNDNGNRQKNILRGKASDYSSQITSRMFSNSQSPQFFTQRIFKASEILMTSDLTEEENEIWVAASDQHQDQQIAKALEKMKEDRI